MRSVPGFRRGRARARPGAGASGPDGAESDPAARLGEMNATLTRILGAIEEYVYTGELLPEDGYRVIFAGPCREQFLGTSAKEAETAVFADYVHPGDVEVFEQAHRALRTTGSLDIEYRMVGADGVTRWVRDRGRLRRSEGRLFLDGSVLDVSSVHRTQAQLEEAVAVLRDSERRAQAILTAAHEAFLAIDSAGRIVDWNAEAAQLFGWTAEEVLGRTLTEFFGGALVGATGVEPAAAATGGTDLARFLAAPQTVLDTRLELPAVHRDRHPLTVEVRMAAAQSGTSRTLYAFLHDISERKLAERQRAEDAENLAAVIEASREMSAGGDADASRAAICRAAARVSDAPVTMLYEVTEGGLVATSAVGLAGSISEMGLDDDPSGAQHVLASGERLFVPDVTLASPVNPRLARVLGASSALFEPVVRGEEVVGVLVVTWPDRLRALPDRVDRILPLVAAEAAVAVDRAQLLSRLAAAARTDALTGLANRRALDEELPQGLRMARRNSQSLSLALIDLDHFKAFNDSHGHQAGDRTLRTAATAWAATMRDFDLLVRYGGEEFIAIFHDCELADALVIVDRLRLATPGDATCSAGVACWDGTESPDDLIRRADTALYAAKAGGRDRVTAADGPGAAIPVCAAAIPPDVRHPGAEPAGGIPAARG